MSGEETDERLIARARDGESAAFAALVRRHYPLIHRVAWRCLGEASEAEDVAQEVCIRLAKRLADFEGRSAFTTWLCGITLNAARDALRVRQRRAEGQRQLAAMALVDGQGPPEAEDNPEDALWDAVRSLPDRQRDAVLLVHAEGMSHGEAARALGCAEATVSWHLFAARRTLKSTLQRRAP
ncbi:Sigma-24 [Hartmannibacter diazotrophicus]|uniref:Sigma-24 n=1 Tax=Hartmannibacter diazotrophicus TaxID=1482074 RepID=A0A2C9DA80_9HYPH|nr:RNA polymerase sigma factor [Hartmannibacter diazotrophicus]SON57133.1 Sigma-24 [Hartmannibacter diazotrophicus]